MWLSLTEYSNKHRVSISTLRRKIKSTEIQFRLDDGKYMILDSEENKFMDEGPSINSFSEQYRPSLKSEIKTEINTTKPPEPQSGESVITAANRLLADLKKAYTQVLQDKEAQISELREEMMDLKTLIKVLESENTRLANKFNN